MNEDPRILVADQVAPFVNASDLELLISAYLAVAYEGRAVLSEDEMQKTVQEWIEEWRDAIKNNFAAVIISKEKPIGMCKLFCAKDKNDALFCEIEDAYVDPQFRKQGLFKQMLQNLFKYCYSIYPAAYIVVCSRNDLVQAHFERFVLPEALVRIEFEQYLREYRLPNYDDASIKAAVKSDIGQNWQVYRFNLSSYKLD